MYGFYSHMTSHSNSWVNSCVHIYIYIYMYSRANTLINQDVRTPMHPYKSHDHHHQWADLGNVNIKLWDLCESLNVYILLSTFQWVHMALAVNRRYVRRFITWIEPADWHPWMGPVLIMAAQINAAMDMWNMKGCLFKPFSPYSPIRSISIIIIPWQAWLRTNLTLSSIAPLLFYTDHINIYTFVISTSIRSIVSLVGKTWLKGLWNSISHILTSF